MAAMPRPHEREPSSVERWARKVQFNYYRGLTLDQRFRVLDRLWHDDHQRTLAVLRERYPAASAREIELRAACDRIGREMLEKVLGEPLPFEP